MIIWSKRAADAMTRYSIEFLPGVTFLAVEQRERWQDPTVRCQVGAAVEAGFLDRSIVQGCTLAMVLP